MLMVKPVTGNLGQLRQHEKEDAILSCHPQKNHTALSLSSHLQ